ncbi:MAG: hypothetical protein FWF76_01205 [Oscillospiraceae bacterium]|nr:hypothetical protein [Oscillospiraceae bacterium]
MNNNSNILIPANGNEHIYDGLLKLAKEIATTTNKATNNAQQIVTQSLPNNVASA